MIKDLFDNIDKIHTTELGEKRVKKNLKIDYDVVDYCKEFIINDNCKVSKKGKNYYCETGNIIITINSSSFTIITAHIKE